jgi:hypothetical protein
MKLLRRQFLHLAATAAALVAGTGDFNGDGFASCSGKAHM